MHGLHVRPAALWCYLQRSQKVALQPLWTGNLLALEDAIHEQSLCGDEASIAQVKLTCQAGSAVTENILKHVQNGPLTMTVVDCEVYNDKHMQALEMFSLEESISYLEQTREVPSVLTLIDILQKCRKEKNLIYARHVHKHICDNNMDAHKVIGNYLIPVFVDCGSMSDAEVVLQKMQERDVHPNRYALHALLRACAKLKYLQRGEELHVEIIKEGFQRDLLVGSTLVDMYAKCGALDEAQDVFDELLVQNVVSWTVLIAGYAEHGYAEEALTCLEKMQTEGRSPDPVTLACSLKACIRLASIDRGYRMHTDIIKRGFEKNSVIGSILVGMYAKCGSIAEAKKVFHYGHLPQNVVSWTSLVAGYIEHGRGKEALDCLEQMQKENVALDPFMSSCSLKACGIIGALDKGRETHSEIVKGGFESGPFITTALVDMYSKCGSLAEAHEMLDRVPVQARNVFLWTALITGYYENGLGEQALNCLEQMGQEGISPNAVTIICSLKVCGSLGAVDKGRELHTETVKEGFDGDQSDIGNVLLDMYAKCGSLLEAQDVFDELEAKDVVSWNALIAGYVRQGESETAFQVFEAMMEKDITPHSCTLLSILTVCSHGGLVDRGMSYFEGMSILCNSSFTIEHCNCMIDLLGRAGQVDLAVGLLESFPFHPDLVTWKTILGACQKWGNLELGREVFQHALALNGNQTAPFTLLSNIFADPYIFDGSEFDIFHVHAFH